MTICQARKSTDPKVVLRKRNQETALKIESIREIQDPGQEKRKTSRGQDRRKRKDQNLKKVSNLLFSHQLKIHKQRKVSLIAWMVHLRRIRILKTLTKQNLFLQVVCGSPREKTALLRALKRPFTKLRRRKEDGLVRITVKLTDVVGNHPKMSSSKSSMMDGLACTQGFQKKCLILPEMISLSWSRE